MLRKLLFLTCVTGLFYLAGVSVPSAMAQSTIQGTVTDSLSGNTLAGTSIFVVDTQRGAATDANGHYEITGLSPGTYSIRASFLGYQTKTKTVTIGNGTTTVDFELASSIAQLGNIVVTTAFGLQEQKATIPYQTTNLTTEDLETAGAISPITSLAGKVAGLQIRRTSSGVRQHLSIVLRGFRSITGGSTPVIVIDGVKATTGAYQALNSNDIKSVNILKGASAAALYGSDAVNGAIVITTKTGNKNGKFTVGLKNSTMWKNVAVMFDHQTKFGSGINGIYTPWENTNWGPRFDGQKRQLGYRIPAGLPLSTQMNPYAYRSHNLRKFYTTGLKLQNTLYFSGGGETGSFYLSGGYVRNAGIVPHDKFQKYTFTANAKKSFGDITTSVHISFLTDHSDVVGESPGDFGVGSQDRYFNWYIINTPLEIPLASYSNWQDLYSYGNPNFYYNAYYVSPWAAIGRNRRLDRENRLRGNIAATWNITDNIDVNGTLGVNAGWNTNEHYRHRQNYPLGIQSSRTPFSGYDIVGNGQFSTINGNVIAEGSFQLSQHFGLDATLGTAVSMYRYTSSSIAATNLSVPGFFDPSNGTGAPITGYYTELNRSYGVFGKLKFNYNKWVYILFTGRQDFTSTLPLDGNSYFYPSEGISLVLTRAIPALGDLPFLSSLRITANNSTVYNDLNPYEVNEVYVQAGGFPLGSVNGFALQGTAVSNNIKKEKIESNEIGLDASFFKRRLSLNASWYYNVTTNLITNITPSITSGATSVLTNIGKMHNTGWGIQLNGDIIRTNDLRFNVGVNLTHYTQIVDKIKPGLDQVPIGGNNYAVVGKAFPLLQVTDYKRDKQGHVVVDPKTGVPVTGTLASFGQAFPNYLVGINPTLSYKGLAIRASMTYRTGFNYYATGLDLLEFTGRAVESAAANRQPFVYPNSVYDSNPDPNVADYVPNTNIPITIPAYTYFVNNYNSVASNYVRDATEFKLRMVAISYTLPNTLLSRTGAISEVTIGLVGRNLLYLTPTDQTRFSDPEYHGGFTSPPPTRSYGFTVNVEF